MLDVSFLIAWILFLFLHFLTNLYFFFLKHKISVTVYFVVIVFSILIPTVFLHWHYAIAGLTSLVFLMVEKRILKKVILLNNVTATFGVFFVISGGFEPLKLFLFCIMTDYALEFTTIIAYKWIIQRRKSHD